MGWADGVATHGGRPPFETSTSHYDTPVGNLYHALHVSRDNYPNMKGVRVGLDLPHESGRQERIELRHGDGWAGATINSQEGSVYDPDAAKPSDHLKQLIAQHHLHPDQWPILLDALQEEYPQLWDSIEAHRAARLTSSSSSSSSGDAAATYARAFAEVSR